MFNPHKLLHLGTPIVLHNTPVEEVVENMSETEASPIENLPSALTLDEIDSLREKKV